MAILIGIMEDLEGSPRLDERKFSKNPRFSPEKSRQDITDRRYVFALASDSL